MVSDCQEDIREVVLTYAICILAIAFWAIVALSLQCCCLSLDGAPGLAAQYFGVVGGIQLGMVVYTATIFFPYCPESCFNTCHDDELGWFYVVPAVEGMIALAWLRASWNRAIVARALRRHISGSENEENGAVGEVAIFTKIPGSELDATEVELTENSETEVGYADEEESSDGVVVRAK